MTNPGLRGGSEGHGAGRARRRDLPLARPSSVPAAFNAVALGVNTDISPIQDRRWILFGMRIGGILSAVQVGPCLTKVALRPVAGQFRA